MPLQCEERSQPVSLEDPAGWIAASKPSPLMYQCDPLPQVLQRPCLDFYQGDRRLDH